MKKRSLTTIGLSLFLIILLSACNFSVVRGSGDLISESRNVRNFDRVALNGSGSLIITQNGEESLVVETDDNIMTYVTTEVHGGTLELGFDSGVNRIISPTKLTFTLSVADLNGLEISGSGDIEADKVESDNFDVNVGGSGDITINSLTADSLNVQIGGSGNIDLSGLVTDQDIQIGGSGKYLAGDLRSETATVEIGGSGNATVWTTNTLNINIGGSGNVNYYGTPTINSSVGGSGSIKSLGDKG